MKSEKLKRLLCTEAGSSHSFCYLFSFCYLKITKKSFHYHRITTLVFRDNVIICQVSFHHVIEVKCVVHDHTDLAVKITASSITEVRSSVKLRPGSSSPSMTSADLNVWMLSLTERHRAVSACFRPWLKRSLMHWSIDTPSCDIFS